MTHYYKYEHLREEDRNSLIPAIKTSSVHAVDHDSRTPVNPEGLADWIDEQRNHDAADWEAELEAEYQQRLLQEETNNN